MDIPFLDMRPALSQIRGELDSAISQVIGRGVFVHGENLSSFERELADYLGAKYCVGVGNGLDALRFSLIAAGVGQGDEVLCVANSAFASALCITSIGAKPVFVDITPETFNMDSELARKKISGKTKAMVPVYLYGNPAGAEEYAELAQEKGIALIEDAAQAHGAAVGGKKAGTFGLAGCFSFYPTKNLGALGDAGAVVTGDFELAEKIRMLRNYGQKNRYEHDLEGFNSRLDELQAAILRIKLRRLDGWNSQRRKIASEYRKGMRNPKISLPQEQPGAHHIYHIFAARCRQRDALQPHLQRAGIQTLIHYPIPAHLQKAYSRLKLKRGMLPNTEEACKTVLSLPIYPGMPAGHIAAVCDAANSFG